ncbi:flagellar export protein FliJ [Shewanella intestini]|uniref:Flagellar FliJ protein n=1 Tax=Shewanella intestini TaxID=2017544 RepID=A0ABS5HYB3_9GAMM|nr:MULTISPECIES: flagellar export protein FliJ [Shewanella]MBR9726772.1 flagellar export protein FliJ [Shewanella intestini]MRG34662.1 flagellar export protein FliJ [Shewanella sp. XMDDZSB0408]
MAKTDPLITVLKLASEAEEQAALQLKAAQFEKQKMQTQLDALNNYRLDYMKQIGAQQGHALSASHYHQFHRFIKQIDDAITQQVTAVKETEKQVGYRQIHWQEKQQKRKAVEMLLEKKRLAAEVAEAKREQKMSDEFAIQQYFRNRQKNNS